MRVLVAAAIASCVGLGVGLGGSAAMAAPAVLVAVVPSATDDARKAIAIGPDGQVYEPDGRGGWSRTASHTVATTVTGAARGKAGVVVGGGGAVYRLTTNGWTAIRLAQKGKATTPIGSGRALAALGRDVFELDKGAEPTRLGQAPGVILDLAGGVGGVVVRTARGSFRLGGTKFTAIKNLPADARLVSDRWALGDRGALDLRAGKSLPWPPGFSIMAASAAPDGSLTAVATTRDGLELVRVTTAVTHEPITVDAAPGAPPPVPVGIASDKQGRIAIALRDGRIVTLDRGTWSTVRVRDELPSPRPGPPPAQSP